MSTQSKIFDVNPEKLGYLLHSIQAREISLPDFQRDFVWDPRATAELIESVCRSFPAGSLLWTKNRVGFASAPRAFAGARELDSRDLEDCVFDSLRPPPPRTPRTDPPAARAPAAR